MFQERTTLLRAARDADIPLLHDLEKRVWESTGVPPLTENKLQEWMDINPQGLIVAAKEEAVCGYVYAESIDFDPASMESPDFQDFVRTGCLVSRHRAGGNTLHGMSIATERPGVGVLLLKEILRLAREGKKDYLVAFARMPGLARFMDDAKRNACRHCAVSNEALACSYAAQCLALVGGSCFSSYVRDEHPAYLPRLRKKDPVLCLFAAILKVDLYGVFPTPFPDPESADRTAFVVRSYR